MKISFIENAKAPYSYVEQSFFGMKSKLALIAIFLLGIAVGIAGMLVMIQKGPREVIGQQMLGDAEGSVIYATLLNDHQDEDLKNVLERSMFASLYAMKGLGFTEQLPVAESLVKGYYDMSGSPVPERLTPYLSGVKGNTSLRQLAAAAKSAN